MKISIARLVCLYLTFFLSFAQSRAQCTIEGPFVVNDFDVFDIELNITGLDNNDMSSPSQGICAVAIEFEHDRVSNLLVELSSPAGQVVTLIGPPGPFGLTSFTNWNISFVPCGSSASPDQSFSPFYTNQNSWGNFGNYTGSYYPFSGCLEDFNSGPANGTWTFTVRDAYQFDQGEIKSVTLFFCDPSGIDCQFCSAPNITFNESQLDLCKEQFPFDSISYDAGLGFDSSLYDLRFILTHEDTLSEVLETNILPDIELGNHEVCGISYEKDDSSQIMDILQTGSSIAGILDSLDQLGICYGISGNCVSITVEEVDSVIEIDTVLCENSYIVVFGDTIIQAGEYLFSDSTSGTCPQDYLYHVSEIILDANVADPEVLNCSNPVQLVDASSSTFSPGTRFYWYYHDSLLAMDTVQLYLSDTGRYKLILEDGLCTDSLLFNLEGDFELPYFAFSGNDTLDCKEDTLVIKVDSTNAVDWQWISPEGDTVLSDSLVITKDGMYSFIALGANGCSLSDSFFVPANYQDLDIHIDTLVNLCANDTIPLSVAGSNSDYLYSWIGPNGFKASSKDTFAFTEGVYTLSVLNSVNGCISIDSFDFTFPSGLDTPVIQSDSITCQSLFAQIELDTVRSDYTYEWITPSMDTLFMAEPQVSESGSFILVVRSGPNCYMELLHEINRSLDLPEVSISGDSLSCDGQPVQLTAMSTTVDTAYKYIWEGPVGTTYVGDTILANLPGMYILTFGKDTVCQQKDTFELAENFPAPSHAFTSDTITCSDTLANAFISGPDSLNYYWSGPQAFTDTGKLITTQFPGAYEVLISSNNCQYFRATRVEEDRSPPAWDLTIQPLNCMKDSGYIIQAADSSLRFSYYEPDSDLYLPLQNFKFASSRGGSYALRLQGSNGCVSDTVIQLEYDTLAPDHTIIFGDTLDCNTDSIFIYFQGGENPSSLQWLRDGIPIGAADSIKVSFGPQVEFLATFSNGCMSDSLYSLPLDTMPPAVNFDVKNLTCDLPEYLLDLSFRGQLDSIFWQTPNGNFSISDSSLMINTHGTYTFSATGENGCTLDSSFTVELDTSLPELVIGNDTVECGALLTRIEISTDTQDIAGIYWQLQNGIILNEMEPELPFGTHTLFIQGKNGCLDSMEYRISKRIFSANVDSVPDTLILTCRDSIRTIRPVPGASVDSFIWIDARGNTQPDLEIEVQTPGLYNFVVYDDNGCADSFLMEVLIDTVAPEVSLKADTLNCRKPALGLNVSTNALMPEFIWTGPSGFRDSVSRPLVTERGTYYLSLTDENGCEVNDSIFIESDFSLPEYMLTDTIFSNCATDSANAGVEVQGVADVKWYFQNQLIADEDSFVTSLSGMIHLILEGENGCKASDSVWVDEEGKLPIASWQTPVLNCRNLIDTIQLVQANGDYSYTWKGPGSYTSGSSSPIVDTGGFYEVTYTNEFACSRMDTLEVPQPSIPFSIEFEQHSVIRCADSITTLSVHLSRPLKDSTISWVSPGGAILSGMISFQPVVKGPGIYIVNITDTIDGCAISDTFSLALAPRQPLIIDAKVKDILCTNDNGGEVLLFNSDSSSMPFTFSINDDAFVNQNHFTGLMAGSHYIQVKDGQGCLYDTTVMINEVSGQGQVDLGPDLEAEAGYDIIIVPEISFPEEFIDSMVWMMNNAPVCINCDSLLLNLDGPKLIELIVYANGGCIFEDRLIIDVPTEDVLFVPNAFSPNDDSYNDYFFVQTALQIPEIKLLQIFDRWGNRVFEAKNFPPNEFIYGWDGSFAGKPMFPQVLAVRIEYEFEGEVRVEHYDLTLTR